MASEVERALASLRAAISLEERQGVDALRQDVDALRVENESLREELRLARRQLQTASCRPQPKVSAAVKKDKEVIETSRSSNNTRYGFNIY